MLRSGLFLPQRKIWSYQLPSVVCFQRHYVSQSVESLQPSLSEVQAQTPKPFSAMPSPKGAVPFVGHYLRLRKKMFNVTMDEMFQEVNGPIFKMKVFGNSIVVTSDPMGAVNMNSVEGQYPSRVGEENIQIVFKKRNEQVPVIFEIGPKWREARRQLGKQATPANAYGYIPGFNRAADKLIRNIKEMQDSDGYIKNINELIMFWSLEAAAWFSLGVELDSVGFADREEVKTLKHQLEIVVDAINTLQYGIPLHRIYPTQAYKAINNGFDAIFKVGSKYADKHMERIMAGVTDGAEKRYGQSLLEQWLIEGKMSKKEAIQNAALMMCAGLDTTSALTCFMLYELSRNKQVQDKLYDQVTAALGKNGEPDTDSLQKISYLMNIVKESHRMHSVIPSHARKIPKDAVINGYNIPAGTVVLYSMVTSGKDSNLFNNPNEFNPDRWSTDDISPYSNTPFGVGPRSCWGRRYAELELKILLIKLSQHFVMEFGTEDKDYQLAYEAGTIIRPSAPICMKFIPR